MLTTISDEARKLGESLREWAVGEGRPLVRAADTMHEFPPGMEKILANCPIQISPISGSYYEPDRAAELRAKYHEGPHVLATIILEAVAYGDMLLFAFLPGNGIGSKVVRLMGTPAQVYRWADGVDRGEFTYTAFGLTEPHSGSDASAMRTRAVRDGDSWVINGSKIFCTGGAISDYIVVFARTSDGEGYRGIRAFVVEKDTPGLIVLRRNEDKLGIRAMQTAALSLEDVRVPLDQCLGADGEAASGYRAALESLSDSRPTAAAISIGVGQAALDYARDFLSARKAEFAAARWDRINLEFRRCDALLETARQHCYRAQWLLDEGLDARVAASMAKAYGPPIAERVCVRALQLMGPEGYSEAHLLEKWARDIKICDIWEGTGNIQRMIIGRVVYGSRHD
jgi:acyl-CoA dehydrogenase